MADPNTPSQVPPTPEVVPGEVAPAVPATPPAPAPSLTDAFKAGQLRLKKGAPVPVRLSDGRIGTVPAEHAQAVVDSGGELVDDAVYQEAHRKVKYGGLGGAAAAVGEGLARGVSVGGSDELAIEAARALGGEHAAEAARKHLAGIKEENAGLSLTSELVGAAAPLLATEGGSAAEQAAVMGARSGAAAVEGAELARAGAAGAEALSGGARAAEAVSGGLEAAKAAETIAKATEAARTAEAASTAASRVAEVAGAVRQGLQYAGAPNRAIAAAGEYAAGGAKAIFGEGASGIAGLGQRLATKATQGAVEGALYGAASEVDESVLGDHDLNAEKLLASVGHGAFLGGAFGGSLEALGSLSRNVIGRAAPKLQSVAEEQAWKSLSPLKKFSEQAEARMPGGTKGVGRVLIEEGVIPESIAGATPEQLLPRIQSAKERIGTELSGIMSESGAKVKVNDILAEVRSVTDPLRKKAGFENIVKALDAYETSLVEKLAPTLTRETAPETKLVQRALSNEEIVQRMQAAGPKGFTPEYMAQNSLESRGGKLYVSEPALTKAAAASLAKPTEVSVSALFEQRKALDDLVYREVKSLDPQMRVEFMREIRAKMANMEVKAIDDAAKHAGAGPTGDQLKDLRRRYQALSIAEDAAETTTSRMATNRNFSLSDYHIGTGLLASGHGLTAALGTLGHKLIRERGNAAAAYTLNKLAALAGVERAAASVDRQIDRGVAGFLKAGSKADMKVKPSAFPSHKEAIKAVAKAAVDDGSHAEQIEKAVAEIAPHAPNTARSFQRTALASTAYLASQVPPNARQFHSPTPHIEEPRISDADAARFMRIQKVVHDPTSVLDEMRKGTLTVDQVDALHATSPGIYNQIVAKVQNEMATSKKTIPYEKRKQLSILFRKPLDPTMTRTFIGSMQKNFGNGNGGGQGQGGAPAAAQPSTPRRSLSKDLSRQSRLTGT